MAVIFAFSAVSALAQKSVLVATENLSKREFNNQITLVGRTEAKIKSRIVAEISGQVIAIDAPEGNPIKKNETLISIDPSFNALELKAKEAEANEARVQADLAKTNLERTIDLRKQNLVSETTLDSARALMHIYSARFERLTAEKDRAALDFEHCRIRAPFSGHTLRRLIDVGEWVNPGTPVYEMVDLSEIKVVVNLPQKYYRQLAMGARAEISIAGNSELIVGHVSGIARAASDETHTFKVIVNVANKDNVVGSGELARVALYMKDIFTSFAVSKDAIIRDGTKTKIYTIKDGKASPVPVITSSTDGDYVAVKADRLTEGMPIVIRGNERIFPGMAVRTTDGEAVSQSTDDTEKDESGSTTN